MFRATFLGHHGWLYASEHARILVDPLFEDRFGFTDNVELRVYPPRRLDFSVFPAIDAVFLTHEHEGHFDIASLNRLDRQIPVYISSRSSLAMRRIFEEMGFNVHLTYPGVPVEIGDIEFFPLTGDQVQHGIIEEWDVLPYLARHRDGDGSLFTNVDLQPTEAMWKGIRERIERPCLWAYTNNDSSWHFTYSWLKRDLADTKRLADHILEVHYSLTNGWAAPEMSLIIGDGFCFGGRRTWLNNNVFPIDHFRADDLMSRLSGSRFLTPVPGQTFVMSDGKLTAIEPSSPFIASWDRSEWLSREFTAEVSWLENYEPACGSKRFPDEELDALQEELTGFARHLYSKDQFRRLYSLTKKDVDGIKPTIALALLADEDRNAYVFEYVPQACTFIPVESSDPATEYLAVYECWATDLLAFLRCEISSTALCFAHSRCWNAKPNAFFFNFNHPLFEYVHPLRMPDRALEFYRRVFERQRSSRPVVRFRE